MSDYTPSVEGIRAVLVYLSKYKARDQGDVDLIVVESETIAQFDRMIAEVERAAAEKAFNYAVSIVGIDLDLVNHFKDSNPYRKAVEK